MDESNGVGSGAMARLTEDNVVGTINLLVVGEGAVGKSCILQAYCGDDDSGSSVKSATIGVDVRTCFSWVRGLPVKLHFYDTAGSERFRSLIRTQFPKAHGVLLVFDFTLRDSFLKLEQWLRDLRAAAKQDPIILLAGNKAEMLQRYTVTREEATAFANQHRLCFTTLSAFCRDQVVAVVEELAHRVLLTPRLYRPRLESSDVFSMMLRLQSGTHAKMAHQDQRLAALEDDLKRLNKASSSPSSAAGSGD